MKKVICLFLIMVCSIFSLTAFAADTSNAIVVRGDVARIEDYMEFYNNQHYYINWARENGYSLSINVPAEYMEIEKARILGENSDASINNFLSGIVTRGLKPPTAIWNIPQKGKYGFTVETASSKVYSNYKFSGKTSYVMNTLNTSNVSSGGTVYGVIGGSKSFSTTGSSTVINFFYTSNLTSSPIYLCFNAPAYLYGNIS